MHISLACKGQRACARVQNRNVTVLLLRILLRSVQQVVSVHDWPDINVVDTVHATCYCVSTKGRSQRRSAILSEYPFTNKQLRR